jgi:hypothetical protein
VVHPPSRIVPHPKDKNFSDLYSLILPPRRLLTFGRGRILIPRFIQSPSTLTAYDVAHSLPLGGVDWDFPFTENETRRHFSYLSGTFREPRALYNINFNVLRNFDESSAVKGWGYELINSIA